MRRARIELGARIELARPSSRDANERYYRMEVTRARQLPLFGESPAFELVVTYGRFGGALRVLRYAFRDLDALAARWQAILATRRRHGYVRPTPKRRRSSR